MKHNRIFIFLFLIVISMTSIAIAAETPTVKLKYNKKTVYSAKKQYVQGSISIAKGQRVVLYNKKGKAISIQKMPNNGLSANFKLPLPELKKGSNIFVVRSEATNDVAASNAAITVYNLKTRPKQKTESNTNGTSTAANRNLKSYKKITILDTFSSGMGSKIDVTVGGCNSQSFAYFAGNYYVQQVYAGERGCDGYIYKYNAKGKTLDKSGNLKVGHGNGLTYCTADNTLYSVTVSSIRDNTRAQKISPSSLESDGSKKLAHGSSSIAYDKVTNRFITSSGAVNGSASSTGYLYVYDSKMKKSTGAKSIAKKRWATPGDIAAFNGVIYVTIYTGSTNYIDMYNEDNGKYLGTYSVPYGEIEGIDIDDSGQLVILIHGVSDYLQFTGVKAL